MNPNSDTTPSAMPTPNKSRRYPDHAKIYGQVKPKKDDPLHGLSYRRDRYWLIYYDHNWVTKMMDLRTQDPVQARRLRDDLYRKARALGRVAQSKLQYYAQKILDEPGKTNHGFQFIVRFGGQTVVCASAKEQVEARARIARELLEKAGRCA